MNDIVDMLTEVLWILPVLVVTGVVGGTIFIVAALAFGSPGPVEWPGALVGVGTLRHWTSAGEPKDGAVTVVMAVDVEPETGEPFESSLSRRIPEHKVRFLERGLRFPVMYRDGRTEKVKIARGEPAERAQRFFDRVRLRDGLIDSATLRADAHGRAAVATITGVRATGKVRGGMLEYELAMRLRGSGGREFDVLKTMPLLSIESSALEIGSVLPARFLDGDPPAVAVRTAPKGAAAAP